jgi:subtilase family serine protease
MKRLSLLTAVFVVCSLSFTGLAFAQPDLVISRINYSPGAPKQNQEIIFWVYVKNIGTSTAESSKLRFKVGGESNPPLVNVPELTSGREFRYERKITLQGAATYWLTATADALHNVTESNDGNNRREERITVKSGPEPDLVISKINLSPGAPYKNEQITFWVFVKNKGQAWSKKSHLRIQVGGETQGKLVQVPALDPGRTWRYEKTHTLNKPGKYLVTATADAMKTIIESKEGNNVRKKKFRVKPGTKPDPDTYLPDLGTMGGTKIGGKTWQSLSVSSVTLTANDVYVLDTGKVQIHLRYVYREYNGKKVNTPFKNRVYYNNQLVHEESVDSMAANEIHNKVVVWQIPNPNFNQQAELKIVIDATNAVTESNPDNNQNITTLTFSGI